MMIVLSASKKMRAIITRIVGAVRAGCDRGRQETWSSSGFGRMNGRAGATPRMRLITSQPVIAVSAQERRPAGHAAPGPTRSLIHDGPPSSVAGGGLRSSRRIQRAMTQAIGPGIGQNPPEAAQADEIACTQPARTGQCAARQGMLVAHERPARRSRDMRSARHAREALVEQYKHDNLQEAGGSSRGIRKA